jgi:hypothetical protein
VSIGQEAARTSYASVVLKQCDFIFFLTLYNTVLIVLKNTDMNGSLDTLLIQFIIPKTGYKKVAADLVHHLENNRMYDLNY